MTPRPNVAGRFLAPATVNLMVDGKPATVHFTRDVILRAHDRLREDVPAGRVGMRWAHPGFGDLPLRYGRATEVRADREKGEVWLAASEPLPELLAVLTPEAAEGLASMGLSFFGEAPLRKRADGSYEATDLRVTHVDIVGKGAFPGSGIVPTVPAGLAAQAIEPARLTEQGEFAVLAAQFTLTPPASGGSPPRGHEEDHTMEPEQLNAQLAAKDTELTAAKEEVRSLQAKVAELTPKAADADQAKEANATLAAKVTDLSGQVQTLLSEKDARVANDDVQRYVAAGRAWPAEVTELVDVRKVTGAEKFKAMMDKRPVIVPPGERGHAGGEPPKGADPAVLAAREAEKDISRFGVEGVITSGMHELQTEHGEAVRAELAAKHADHPLVRKHLGPAILAAKAAGANGKGKVS